MSASCEGSVVSGDAHILVVDDEVPDELGHGDLAAFEPSNDAIEFEAQSNA